MTADPHALDHPPFDAPALLRRLQGDAGLAGAMAALCLQDLPAQQGAIRDAIAAGDSEALAHVAHALKGAVSNFGATETAQAAQQLESMGLAGNLAGADAAVRALDTSLERLVPALRALIA